MSLSRWLRKGTVHRRRAQTGRRRTAVLPAPCQLETLENRCLLSAIQFAEPVYRIAEGTRSVDVTLTRDSIGDADSVLVVATGGTATGGASDYWDGAFPVNAVFQPGEREVTVTLVLVSPMGNQVLEGVETIELGLIDNDHRDVTFGEQSKATIEIHDAYLSIDRHKYINEHAGHQSITVTLNIGQGFTLQEDAVSNITIKTDLIFLAVVHPDGIRRSVASPNDYWLVTRQIRFAAGSGHGATRTIGFIPLEDDRPEGIESFYFGFEQVSGAPFARHRSPVLSIIDVPEEQIGYRYPFIPVTQPGQAPSPAPSPPPPAPPPTNFQPPLTTIEFRDPVYRIAEGTRTVEVTLVRGRIGGSDSVLVVTTGGTATAGGEDYWEGAFPVNAIFQPGEREVTVTLVLMSPERTSLLEGVETIELGLVDNDHYNVTFGEQSTATIEIHDAYLSIDRHEYIDEDSGYQWIEVTLNTADGVTLQEDAVFNITVETNIFFVAVDHPDGIRRSVARPNDYVLGTRQIRFASGSGNGATQKILFVPLADDRHEGIESFYFGFEQVSGSPFARDRSPILSIIDVPEEWIGQRPPFVRFLPSSGKDVAEGRRDADVDAGLITTPAENASGGTASTGGVASLTATPPLMVTGSASAVLFATEAPMIPVPEFQTAEPLPLGRMDLLAEFLSGSEPLSGLEEPGANGPGTTTSLSFAANSDSFESEGLDSAFSDDELLGDLTLLGPVL